MQWASIGHFVSWLAAINISFVIWTSIWTMRRPRDCCRETETAASLGPPFSSAGCQWAATSGRRKLNWRLETVFGQRLSLAGNWKIGQVENREKSGNCCQRKSCTVAKVASNCGSFQRAVCIEQLADCLHSTHTVCIGQRSLSIGGKGQSPDRPHERVA